MELDGALDHALVIVAIILSIVLTVFAAASLGRKLTDLEILQIRGLNGVRLLEIEVKIRAQVNRVLVALVFGGISALILADAPIEWRVWCYRFGVVLVLLAFSVSAVLDWFVDRHQLRMVMAEEFQRATTELEES
jgi:hypothetical protein